MWLDLLAVAVRLTEDHKGQSPTQAALRRLVSTSYYALFTSTAEFVANIIIGTSQETRRTSAWSRAFRSLEHGSLKAIAKSMVRADEGPLWQNWSRAFLLLQENRHAADYDPNFTITSGEALDFTLMACSASECLGELPEEIAKDFVAKLAFRDRK